MRRTSIVLAVVVCAVGSAAAPAQASPPSIHKTVTAPNVHTAVTAPTSLTIHGT
jgi:hypothetical protein